MAFPASTPLNLQSSIPARVTAEHSQEIRQFFKMSQCVLGFLVVDVSKKIQIKQIFERLSTQWARLDLGEADVAQGECTQAAKEGAR